MKPIIAEPGTVSSGTLRPEDLIPRFLSFLAEHNVKDADAGYEDIVQKIRKHREVDHEEEAGLLEQLFDEMNDIAPPGHSFGAHPGDGADFGFWPEDGENPSILRRGLRAYSATVTITVEATSQVLADHAARLVYHAINRDLDVDDMHKDLQAAERQYHGTIRFIRPGAPGRADSPWWDYTLK